MSKKPESSTSVNNWKYICKCGYDTIKISSAVSHLNSSKNKEEHQLQRVDL